MAALHLEVLPSCPLVLPTSPCRPLPSSAPPDCLISRPALSPSPAALWTLRLGGALAFLLCPIPCFLDAGKPLLRVIPHFREFLGLVPPSSSNFLRASVWIPCVSLCWVLGGSFDQDNCIFHFLGISLYYLTDKFSVFLYFLLA